MKVVHLICQFDIGGLEKVMSDTINGLPEFEHHIIVLDYVTENSLALIKNKINISVLNKKKGNDLSLWKKLYKLFKTIKPDVLHSYNLPTLEYQFLGFFCRIPTRVHAEHGRDISDPDGQNKKYQFLRRLLNPFIHYWIPVSKDLAQWLNQDIGIVEKKINLIHNGVDTHKFRPVTPVNKNKLFENFFDNDDFIIGTIGRLDPVKNQKIFIRIYQELLSIAPDEVKHIKFAIVGSGPFLDELKKSIESHQFGAAFWLPGARYQINDLLNGFDIFALPSIAEGIPMTILEAMSASKPVIASSVGGIPEIITDGCGILLPVNETKAWANAILDLYRSEQTKMKFGLKARKHIEQSFSIYNMLNHYRKIYSASH